MRPIALLLAGICLALASCSGVQEKAEQSANRSFTSYALGRPYQQVAAVGTSPLDRLAGNDGATFGPMIGATPLSNGMVIFRHIAPAARTETGTSFAGVVGTSGSSERDRLSYFLVGPDGIVKDWATGQVQGTASSCISYIGGIVNRCSDTTQLRAALDYYDAQVTTRGGQPVSSWGTAEPIEADNHTN